VSASSTSDIRPIKALCRPEGNTHTDGICRFWYSGVCRTSLGAGMGRLARIVSGRRSRWACLAVWIVVIAVLAPLGGKMNDITSEDLALPAGSQSNHVQALLRDRFATGDERTAVLVYSRPGGLTQADRAKIAADATRAATVPLVGTPVPPFTAAGAGQVSKQGDVAFTIVPIVAKGRYHVTPTMDALRKLEPASGGLSVHVTGDAALISDVRSALRKSDTTLLLMTVALVLLLLVAVYRAPLLALIPLVTVGLGYAVATGIIYLLAKGGVISVDSTAVSLLLVLMFGAGTDYCLLLVSRYRSALRANEDRHEAMRQAVEGAGPAMLASGLTVGLALLAMLTSTLGLNRTLGPVNAIGIGVLIVVSLTLLPALLSLLGRRGFWPAGHHVAYGAVRLRDATPERTAWGRIGARVRSRPVVAAVAGVAILGAGAFGLLAYRSNIDPTVQLRQNPDSKQGEKVLLSRFPAGALAPMTVLVESPTGPVRGADVARVRSVLASTPQVAQVRVDPTRSRDGRIAALDVAFVDDPYGQAAFDRVAKLRKDFAAMKPDLLVFVGHGAAARADYQSSADRDLKVVIPVVLAVVLLMLVILLRAFVAPVYLLASVILSFLGSFGLSVLAFRYLFGQPGFDTDIPIFIFIFLVALGSDYTIFLMSAVREEAAKHGVRDGTLRALASTGPVITSAGLILAGTFAALTVLPVWLLFDVGFAVALGVLLDTFVVRTLLVPAITWLVGERAWWPSTSAAQEAPPVSAPEAL
jgi:RND superfamily putative drug exporter